MDPNRHHEFIASSEDRSRTVYMNKGVDGMRLYNQYYGDKRDLNNKKGCSCTHAPGNTMCNGCRSITPEESWRDQQRTQGAEFGNADIRNNVTARKGPIYIHSSVASVPYWQQNNQSYMEGAMGPGKSVVAAQMDGNMSNIPNKTRILESNYNYKETQSQPQPQQTQLHTLPAQNVGALYKDRSYESVYSSRQDSPVVIDSKLSYSTAVSSATALYNVDTHYSHHQNHVDTLRSLKNERPNQTVVNPTNMLASKDQHPSPNYARKCPSIFPPDEQNSAHLNLYVSAPQFSSDKFATIHAQPNLTKESTPPPRQQDYHRGYSSTLMASQGMHLLPETSKLGQNPVQMSSPARVYASQNRCKQVNGQLKPMPPQQQMHQPQTPYSSVSSTPTRTLDYCTQSPSDATPAIPKPTQNHYQYSNPPSHIVAAKISAHDLPEYVKKEEMNMYNSSPDGSGRSLYKNPYNTSTERESCCKEYSYSTMSPSNYRIESPSHSYSKYEKVPAHDLGLPNSDLSAVSAQVASRGTSVPYRGLPSYYYESPVSSKYENLNNTSPQCVSPKVALGATPPSATITQTQLRNNTEYGSPRQHAIVSGYQQQQHQNDIRDSRYHSMRGNEACTTTATTTSQSDRGLYDYHNMHHSSKTQFACNKVQSVSTLSTHVPTPQSPSHPPPSSHALSSQATALKKSHAPKPNYRELIYAMRNNNNEDEMNLKIIKKTLNVDPNQVVRPVPPVGPTGSGAAEAANIQPPPVKSKKFQVSTQSSNLGPPLPQAIYASSDTYMTKVAHAPPPNSFINAPPPTPVTGNRSVIGRSVIKTEEKSSASPLDLSMRTVKTKADSTEYQSGRNFIPLNAPNIESKSALPKVDFTPNFSLHTVSSAAERAPSSKVSKQPSVRVVEQSERGSYAAYASHPSAPPMNFVGNSYNSNHMHYLPLQSSQSTQSSQPSLPIPKLPTSQAETARSHQHQHQLQQHYVVETTASPPVRQVASPYNAAPSKAVTTNLLPTTGSVQAGLHTIKSPEVITNNISREPDTPVMPVRRSVVETNPYATVKSEKREVKLNARNVLATEQLCPDTGVLPVPKEEPCPINSSHTASQPLVEQSTNNIAQNTYAHRSDSNFGIFGRKRHYEEYTNLKHHEPVVKQVRYEPTTKPTAPGCVRPGEITVIKLNEKAQDLESIKTAEKSIQAEIRTANAIKDNEMLHICKTEPVTPTAEVLPPLPMPTVKTETIAARIRTKAELKGFTFNTPTILESALPMRPMIKIKEELPSPKLRLPDIELPTIPGLNDEFSRDNLLDLGWSSACNNFVEQLKKRQPAKQLDIEIKTELIESIPPVHLSVIKKDESHDNLSNMESAEGSISFGKMETTDYSVMTAKTTTQDSAHMQAVIQKKISKLDRDKIRLHQEQRIAARLQDESSSETDDELNKRHNGRLVKPLLRKNKNCQNKLSRNRFSDCGSDSSSSESDQDNSSNQSIKNVERQRDQDVILMLGSEKKEMEEATKNAIKVINHGKGVLDRTDTGTVPKCSNKTEKDDAKLNKTNDKSGFRDQTDSNNVQYNDESNNKPITKKSKLYSKVGLNTMTRSKRKRELEIQLANSKVLRNDKIIRNSTTKIKRKYVRKFVNNQQQNTINHKDVESEESGNEEIATRLRTKNEKKNMKVLKKSNQDGNKAISNSKIKGGQNDCFIEEYRYKRSLKIPPSLITIKPPSGHKIAASLPDLERNVYDSPFRRHRTSIMQSEHTKPHVVGDVDLSQGKSLSCAPKSIIDLLHSRVIRSVPARPKPQKNVKSAKVITTTNTSSPQLHTEVSQSSAMSDLLPTPKKGDDDRETDGKKRHFSIFDTKILQTKTRTESKLQQKREIIREIFVGDDRPASAPPEIIQTSEGTERMTYEQKYEQFLRDMNEDTLRNFGRASTYSAVSTLNLLSAEHILNRGIKQEDYIEGFSMIDVEEKLERSGCQGNILSTNNSPISLGYRRRRPGKYLRRKGSSGFDYIRKKKKPTPLSQVSSINQPASVPIKLERTEDEYELRTKTESDVCREIQKWVLNKGVGQSTMHKAARMGYIDVIVYCLERMSMNPDQKDNAGYTPLHEACTHGWLEIARILLQYGANHSEAAHSGIRPLHEASENDNEEIVRLLLSYGADPLLATYSGQTPLMLASSTTMRDILNNHLRDVQNTEPNSKPWHFNGPWEIFDGSVCGYDVFGCPPNYTCDMSRALRKSLVSSVISNKKQLVNQYEETSSKTVMDKCAVVLDNIDRFNSMRLFNDNKSEFLVENSDSEGEIFEFEEADILLPPLYLLKDEGTDKWVLLNDLCNLLKVKSKDTLLNKICPSSSVSSAHKSLMKELKMSDFLEKATCLQLLCAGEKINICASKVVLIKYNESVRNLLGVKTILMKF